MGMKQRYLGLCDRVCVVCHSHQSRYGEFKTLSLSSTSLSTDTKPPPEVDSYYKDRETRRVQTDWQRQEGRQTGSLFSSLFLDKYLISGTLMGID